MFSIEKQIDVSGTKQVVVKADHSARMTLAERGGRAIMRVLSKNARVVSAAAVLTGADVEVSGRMVVSAVCEISGGEVVCLEYSGVFNFNHKAPKVSVPSCCDVSAIVSAVRVLRASGCEVALEVDMDFIENFAVGVSTISVVSASDCYSEVKTAKAYSGNLKVHNFTAVAEMDVNHGISEILATELYAESTGVVVKNGSAVCSGNIHGWISFIDLDGKVKNQPCSFPYREEFSASAAGEFGVFARVGECKAICEVNEVRGLTAVTFEVDVELSLWGYVATDYEVGSDFFCDKVEITAEYDNFVTSEFCGSSQSNGKAIGVFDWQYDLPSDVSVVSARVAKIAQKGESGIFKCDIACVVAGADMKFQDITISGEVAFPVNAEGKIAVCDVVISEISAKIAAGKVEVSGKLCGNLLLYADVSQKVATVLVSGAEKENCSGGFVLYRAENGETLLDVCGAVGVMPQLLKKQNPSVTFPIVGEAKVVVWKGEL